MPQIRVLADDLINKIAAGEVIERPASVVKELVENALDAGASRITVEVEAGGKRLIRVTDDGCGMSRDDALLAVERHATSKLQTVDDLKAIATLGFRGEALPSIASVSRFSLESRPGEDGSGTRIEIDGGKMRGVTDAGCPPGTRIEVRGLFSRMPARRKFLRTDTTELAHVATLVTNYALAHPEVGFTLKSGDHTVLSATPVSSLSERVYQVLGAEAAADLVDLGDLRGEFPAYRPDAWFQQQEAKPVSPGTIAVRGFISRPEVRKASSKTIYLFVNRRFVRDRVLLKAIREAYRHVLPERAYPNVLLFLEVPHGEVDVNVHPQKTEVRFRHLGFVHDFVMEGVRRGLAAGQPMNAPDSLSSRKGAERTLSDPAPVPQDADWPEGGGSSATAPMPFSVQSDIQLPERRTLPLSRLGATVEGTTASVGSPDTMPLRSNLAGLKLLGQLNNSFIVAVNDTGLWVVDQHVAHERILFEGHVRAHDNGKIERQGLLAPVIVDLTPAQDVMLERIEAELSGNGFDIDKMGNRSVAVKSAPAGIAAGAVERLLFEIFDTVEKETREMSLQALQWKISASVSCHAAIKINTPLDSDKMQWLLDELAKTDNPSTCPHGRPIVLRYSLRDILKSFKRI